MRELYLFVRFIEILAAFLVVTAACFVFVKWLKRR
jgi:hypothetical protein